MRPRRLYGKSGVCKDGNRHLNRQASSTSDPLIGSVVADRYEIVQLLSSGGMARIYRAVQRSLNRPVVVKVIDPALMSGDEISADEAVARFMVEAQAASRLNHPNLINVFDFGRTSPSDGGQLFLVMELLAGPNLGSVLDEQRLLPIPRIVHILRQALAGLGEAHYLGIAHRDVKPENLIIEARRSGIEHVKVIDFGLAKVNALQNVTRAGRTVGTPDYMSPEQVHGKALGSGDLYAIGIMLFEMLTGVLPFTGSSPVEVMLKHIQAPRPDPRVVAPDRAIPPALAMVCMRAMHADPAERFDDAESLASAIARAAAVAEWTSGLDAGPVSWPERPSAPPPPKHDGGPAIELNIEFDELPTLRHGPALVGRGEDLGWALDALSDVDQVAVMAVSGRSGIGKTRFLEEVVAHAEEAEMLVVRPRLPPHPLSEVGYSGLRRIIVELTAMDPASDLLGSGEAASESDAAAGLRAIFSGTLGRGPKARAETRRCASAALAWASERAVERGGGAAIVLALDDVDRLDGASLLALQDLMGAGGIARFLVAVTSQGAMEGFPAERTRHRALGGLGHADAARLLDQEHGLAAATKDELLDREPLHIELVRRSKIDDAVARSRSTLAGLVEWRLQSLPMVQRRVLQAVAVTGGGTSGELSAVATRRGDVDRALGPLVEAGFLEVDMEGGISLTHEVFGRTILATMPAGVVAELHALTAVTLASQPERVELRAYHAVRGLPDFQAFMLVEGAAALRAARGDDAGTVAMLSEGMRAGRTLLMHGESEAGGSACVAFGPRLGAALLNLERVDEAFEVLQETLSLSGPDDLARARVLEQLVHVARRRNQHAQAEAWRREAADIARACGDHELAERCALPSHG